MSDRSIVSQQALTDSLEPLRKLRDQLAANLGSIKHVGLDSSTRHMLAAVHRSLLATAENSTEGKAPLAVLNSLRVMGIVGDPRRTMEPAMLLGELDTLIELVVTSAGRPTPAAVPASAAAPFAVAHPAKRGRKAIPVQRKLDALAAKVAGKSNKQTAQILYETPYPSARQVKNVSAILGYFKKSRAYAEFLTATAS